jgi:hypothetical protein
LPSFLCRPALVVGIPVAFEIFLFIFVIPSARFQLKDRPGILLFAIWRTTFYSYIFDCTKCNNRHIAPLQKYLEGHKMLCNDVKRDTIEYQKMLEEAFDLIQKLSDEQLQKIMEALK